MAFRIQLNCDNIDWSEVRQILKKVEMAYFEPEKHKRAFEASYTTVFIYDDTTLVAIGRAISDGEYEAAVYDIAVLPEYQRQGLGRVIMEKITETLDCCNIILFANPGKEGFYQQHQFSRLKTGMARFSASEVMRDLGFIE